MPANLRNKNHNKRVPNKFHVLIRRRTFLKTKRNNIQSELKKSFNERYILAAKNGDLDEIKFCIEKNVDINYKDSDHKTALFYAAKYERIEAVKYLVENGADVNIKDKDGRTILMCLSGKYDNLYKSCYEKMMTEHDKNLKIISFLIEKGALVNLKDNFGNDAMQYALLDNIGNYNNREINLLIRSGADLYSFGAAYVFKNAFIWLLYEGSLETLKYVIEKGVDISNKKENLDYPIFYAIDGENLEIIKYMLEQKVDVNVKDSYNQTPLMRAAQNGNLKIMQLLINGGAKVNEIDRHGYTAMDYLVNHYESKYANPWGDRYNQDDKHLYEPYVKTGIAILAKAGANIPFEYVSYVGILNYITKFV